jgi:hypothetical protein
MDQILTDLGVYVVCTGAVSLVVARVVKARVRKVLAGVAKEYQDADAFVTGLIATVNERLGGRVGILENVWSEANAKNVDMIARQALLQEVLSVPQRDLRIASLARIAAAEARKITPTDDPFHASYVNGRPNG